MRTLGQRAAWLGLLALGLQPIVGARPAHASEVRTVSRTVGEAYMVRLPGPAGEVVGRRRLAQMVELGVYRILPPTRPTDRVRRPDEGQLQIVTSLRLRHDFGTFLRHASGNAQRLLESIDGRQIDLLYGYFEGQRIWRWLDFRLGRQFEMSGLDFYAFDGGFVRVRSPAHLAVEVFAGVQVDGSAVFGYPTFELDGTQGRPADRSASPMIGAAVALDALAMVDARVAYRRTWSPHALNRDVDRAETYDPTITGRIVDQEVISATAAARIAGHRVNPFAAARYNLGTHRLDDLSAGVMWAISPFHSVRAMYVRTIPSFDLDSIFNVFSLQPFEEFRAVYQVRSGPRWTIYSRVQARLFHADKTSGGESEPDALRIGMGGGAGANYRRRRFAMRLDGFGLDGEGGLRVGGSIDTRTHVLYDRISFDGRAYGLYYRDENDAARRGHSVALQIGTNVELAHGIHINVVAEELFAPSVKHAFRGFATLSFDWALRVGTR